MGERGTEKKQAIKWCLMCSAFKISKMEWNEMKWNKQNETDWENYVIFSEVIKNHNCFAYSGKYSLYSVGQWLRI